MAQRAAAKLKEAALPPRMEMWEITKKMKQAGGGKDSDPTSSFSFRPTINHTVPDFDKHRQEWDATLQVGYHAISQGAGVGTGAVEPTHTPTQP